MSDEVLSLNSKDQSLNSSQINLFENTLASRLIITINEWRDKASLTHEKIKLVIKMHKNTEDKTIVLNKIGKVIQYEKEEDLERLLQYLNDIQSNSQYLSKFKFLRKENLLLEKGYKQYIFENQGSLLSEESSFEEFKKDIPSEIYFSLYIEDVDINNLDMVVSYIIIQECLLLFKQGYNNLGAMETDGFRYEFKGIKKPISIAFLSSYLNGICTLISKKRLESERRDIYILLLSDTESQMPSPKRRSQRIHSFYKDKKKINAKKVTIIRIPKIRHRNLHTPRKYENYEKRKLLIGMKSIKKLVKLMDTDFSNFVDLQEI